MNVLHETNLKKMTGHQQFIFAWGFINERELIVSLGLVKKCSCILADEMRLSNTIQLVDFLDKLHHLPTTKTRWRLFNDLANIPWYFCLLLTGTPLQNSTDELWNILIFPDPVFFRCKEDLVFRFSQLVDSKQVSGFHSVRKLYFLQHIKTYLSPKAESITNLWSH